LSRLSPQDAALELSQGALLVDLRTETQRQRDGAIPGAVVIDRTVLEWRIDPTSPWHIPQAKSLETRVILICAQGYSSTLAATPLMSLGLRNVTDVIGGFEGWAAAALPTAAVKVNLGEPDSLGTQN